MLQSMNGLDKCAALEVLSLLTYLGVLVGSRARTISKWDPIVCKIDKELASRKNHLL